MLDLFTDPATLATQAGHTVIPFAVLVTSVIGSTHCVGMCGGIVVAASTSQRAHWGYQIGRLAGYLVLGAIAGALGSQALNLSVRGWSSWLAASIIAFTFIVIGLRTFRGAPHTVIYPRIVVRMLDRLWARTMSIQHADTVRGTLIGMLSVFLPCGWLYGFVAAAATTGSATRGALFLALFWLGSVPALGVAPVLIQQVLRPLAAKAPRLSGGLLVSIGIATLALKLSPLILTRDAHITTSAAIAPLMPIECPLHTKKNK